MVHGSRLRCVIVAEETAPPNLDETTRWGENKFKTPQTGELSSELLSTTWPMDKEYDDDNRDGPRTLEDKTIAPLFPLFSHIVAAHL